ncbi:MAG: MerR family transcriptional regulator [Proteobacteria bacterium]|nr:MerR family transcriptional regulator [Pseudomonadota bacterium]
MKIGELAQRSGLSPSRIRFYESRGLLQAVSRQTNGYREYPSDALLTLQLIVGAQNAGFSLDEIGRLIPPDLSAWNQGELIDGLQRKVAQIDAAQVKLAQSRAHLMALITEIQNKPEDMACADNARQFLDRVRGDALAAGAATGRTTPAT